MARFSSRLALGVAVAAVLSVSGAAQIPTPAGGWTASNFNETANRYSPLDQITAANVATLQPAWRFHMKPAGYTGALKTDEAIPVVIGNMMYVASPYGFVHALDATTGVEKWKFHLPRHKRDDPNELAGGTRFHLDVLDTWSMTITRNDREFIIRQPGEKDYIATDEGDSSIDVPDKPWMALRITRDRP